MKKTVQIRFKPAGKVYDFEAGAFVLNRGNHVIVETKNGLGYGIVVNPPVMKEEASFEQPLRKVFRLATEKDWQQRLRHLEKEKSAKAYCQQCIDKLGLKMNLFQVENTFDGSKLTFFFTAEGRVDFRQLVKMLVRKLGVRIEMRQVGIRNQAKMCGGLGRCGREICCATFINKFEPVSIRMAKAQGLSLNPTKISGLCGRLMCCLTYENEVYDSLKRGFPRIGKRITCCHGQGKVIRHNVLGGKLSVRVQDGREVEVGLEDIQKNNAPLTMGFVNDLI